MPTGERKNKSFKFVGGAKYERSGKWLTCPRKGQFRAHTVINESKQTSPNTNLTVNRDNNSNPNEHNIIQPTQSENPAQNQTNNSSSSTNTTPPVVATSNFDSQSKAKIRNLKKFIYKNYSFTHPSFDEIDILKILDIDAYDIDWLHSAVSTCRYFTLQYPYPLPTFSGSSNGITTIKLNSPNLTFFNHVFLDEFNDPLQSHLINLYFKYFNPYCTIVHPLFFQYRIKNHFNRIDFQTLLSMILSLSCSYLAVEPYQSPVNISEFAQYHFERAFFLLKSIDENDKLAAITKIQALLICINCDYSKISSNLDICWELADRIGWNLKFTRSSQEIAATRPSNLSNSKFEEWQQELLIWCTLVFYSNMTMTFQIPVQRFKFSQGMPSIKPALKALFTSNDQNKWINSIEAQHTFLLYSASRFIDKSRIFNSSVLVDHPLGCTSTPLIKSEMDLFKLKITKLKDQINEFYPVNEISTVNLTAINHLNLIYWGIALTLQIPYLPPESSIIQNSPSFLRASEEFIKLSSKISILTTSQGTWSSVYATSLTNFILSVSWCGVNHLQKVYAPQQVPPDYDMDQLVHLLPTLNERLSMQLERNFSFRFHKQFASGHIKRRASSFWVAFRHDPGIMDIVHQP